MEQEHGFSFEQEVKKWWRTMNKNNKIPSVLDQLEEMKKRKTLKYNEALAIDNAIKMLKGYEEELRQNKERL